jgi:hypothetical protein
MKSYALLTALLIGASSIGPSAAFEKSSNALRADAVIQAVSCNPNDDDKQAQCARKCEDEWIKSSQGYGTKDKPETAAATRKACDAACGC